eukprot:7387141-Prymnesium_polylepis.1
MLLVNNSWVAVRGADMRDAYVQTGLAPDAVRFYRLPRTLHDLALDVSTDASRWQELVQEEYKRSC